MATCSSVDKTGINEVLKRPEIKEALKQDRITKEISLVEELLAEISKNTKVSRPTVSQALDVLMRLKKVKRVGQGRTTRYSKI